MQRLPPLWRNLFTNNYAFHEDKRDVSSVTVSSSMAISLKN